MENTMLLTANFVQAGLMAVAMMMLVGEKTKLPRTIVFALLYGLAMPLARSIYSYFTVPFFSHTLILIVLGILLFWQVIGMSALKAITAMLMGIIIAFIIDGLIVFQVMNFFHLTVESVELNKALLSLFSLITSGAYLAVIIIHKFTGASIFR